MTDVMLIAAVTLAAAIAAGASSILVAWVGHRPTKLQIQSSTFEQLQELSESYRTDLLESRMARAEALRIEQALRADLDKARAEMEMLRAELAAARAEIEMLRRLVRSPLPE